MIRISGTKNRRSENVGQVNAIFSMRPANKALAATAIILGSLALGVAPGFAATTQTVTPQAAATSGTSSQSFSGIAVADPYDTNPAPGATGVVPNTVASPNNVPVGGGGGFEYSQTTEGTCGTVALGINNIGGGWIEVGIGVTSFIGLMEGEVKLTYSGGSMTFAVSGLNWGNDTILINGHFKPGEAVGAVVSGDGIIFVEGDGSDCDIPPPVVTFTY